MKNTLFNRDIISIADLSKAQIELILDTAQHFKSNTYPDLLNGKVIASCFFEPSTRTRLSFESAVYKMGGSIIGFDDNTNTSAGKKGETLWDSIKVIAGYSDALIIRHPNAGAARLAAEVAEIPVINAGDGDNQHPSQTLLDLFTIQESQGHLDELHIALVGDLRYGRTVHSLAQALSLWPTRLYFVTPDTLAMPDYICDHLRKSGTRFSCHQNLHEIIDKVDVLYMTRLQRERFAANEFEQIKEFFILTPDLLKLGKANLRIMHPLPRMYEIDKAVDALPQAYYFEQAANGIPTRQAMISLLMYEEMVK